MTKNLIKEEYNKKFIEYRKEGVKKYKGYHPSAYLPPTVITMPKIYFKNDLLKKRIVSFVNGKIKIHEYSPEYKTILNHVKKLKKEKISILDIGCADCSLADFLEANNIKIDYEGLDISKIESKYKIYSGFNEIPVKNKYDLIVMSHVAEHMNYEQYLSEFQGNIKKFLAPSGYFVFATPNPYNIRTQFGDLTHTQIYPWHQTYSLLRFDFKNVNVFRGVYLTEVSQIIFYPIKVVLSKLLDIEYSNTLIYICDNN
jgi:2-polyprenyl-3-methyl-5-hydroxy-6-metoxy-1,4-benzoquinol methylase